MGLLALPQSHNDHERETFEGNFQDIKAARTAQIKTLRKEPRKVEESWDDHLRLGEDSEGDSSQILYCNIF